MKQKYSRRDMLRLTAAAGIAGSLGLAGCSSPARNRRARRSIGAIDGEETGAAIGRKVLADGGNAVDAAVAAALAACVATPSRCGVAGYGGHMILAMGGGRKFVSIDFNTMAPAAATPDMYPLDEKGEVRGRENFFGWRAVGVPGTLAGLQLALERYGTRSFRELVQPAIRIAREGFLITPTFANTLRSAAPRFRKDPGSRKIYLRGNEPLRAGELLKNPELANLLETLAERNSVASFYTGDIAREIAGAIQKNGGLLTAADLAAYKAREVQPLTLPWKEFTLATAPLTAGGLSTLQMFSVLEALHWQPAREEPASWHAWLEALRVTWKDRLELLGDPDFVQVPVQRLLSSAYAEESARRIKAAVAQKKPLALEVEKHLDEGTNNLCAVDPDGNMLAITLTQGGGFGAQVTVDGLGITLGHGMSRFVPRPGHPNSPAPHKRPLHNMCPSLAIRDGRAVLACGGAGGQRIPNMVYELFTRCLIQGLPIEQAVPMPRLYCTGSTDVTVEQGWPQNQIDYFRRVGFKVRIDPPTASHLSAASFSPETGECKAVLR